MDPLFNALNLVGTSIPRDALLKIAVILRLITYKGPIENKYILLEEVAPTLTYAENWNSKFSATDLAKVTKYLFSVIRRATYPELEIAHVIVSARSRLTHTECINFMSVIAILFDESPATIELE